MAREQQKKNARKQARKKEEQQRTESCEERSIKIDGEERSTKQKEVSRERHSVRGHPKSMPLDIFELVLPLFTPYFWFFDPPPP